MWSVYADWVIGCDVSNMFIICVLNCNQFDLYKRGHRYGIYMLVSYL